MKAQLALYGLFLDYATGRITRKYLSNFLNKLKRRTGIDRVVFFMFDVEPWSPAPEYKKFAKMTPYTYSKILHKYVLKNLNTKYFSKLDRFFKIGKEAGVMLIPTLFPCRYVDTVFRKSVEVYNATYLGSPLWSPDLLKYQYDVIDATLDLMFKYYRKPFVSLSNEAQHGTHEVGFILAKVHRDWFERTELPLERVVLDPSHSEFVIAELVEPHPCWGKTLGDPKYARDKNHHVICEHGIGLASQVDHIVGIYDGSAWRRNSYSVFSSDGNTEGHGDRYVLHEDVPDGYKNVNHMELYDKAFRTWGYSRGYIVEELPMEIWERTAGDFNNAISNYDRLKFGRLRQLRSAWEKLFGTN